MIKLGTVIPYIKKNQKIYKSRDTHTANFTISRNIDIDWILIYNF